LRLRDADLGRLSFRDAVLDAAHRGEGIERHDVARDHGIEEMPERGERLVLRRRGAFELSYICTGQSGRDLRKFDLVNFAPVQQPPDDPDICAPRMFIVERPLEKFLIGEFCVSARALDGRRNGRKTIFKNRFVCHIKTTSLPAV
jgi:hypothetical protein